MKRGRKALVIPTVEWKCRVPVDIAAKVDTFLLDPVRGEVAYGKRSQLVTQLLREWLASHSQQPAGDNPHTNQEVTTNA